MRLHKSLPVAVLGAVLGIGLAACEKQGPAERAGEKIDNAAENVQDAAKDAADDVKDAAEDVREEVKDATN